MGKIVLENFNEGNGYYKVNLAYLSKEQVEEIETLVSKWKPTDEDIKSCICICLTDANEQRFKDYGTNLKDCLAWLKKQGEQKSKNESTDTCDSLIIKSKEFPAGEKRDFGYFSESADKIEPKFKIGDWIVSKTSNLVYRVDSILFPQSKCYYLSHNGSIVLVNFADEQNYRLWTIQDAKAGDVLATKNAVFIFKHMDKTGLSLCKSYCEVIGNSKLGFGFDFSINDVYPATKEQCQFLFQKMKDDGYEWDAEKKEPKKIKVNTIWSEEDYNRITSIKYLLHELDNHNFDDWFDSLKYKPQYNKPSWSEEDERICQCLIEDQEESLDNVRNDKYGHSEIISDLKEMYGERIDWLKSIKERIGWKPSELQIEALESVTENCAYSEYQDCLRELIKHLKKL